MASLRNNDEAGAETAATSAGPTAPSTPSGTAPAGPDGTDTALLDAAREAILAVGWRRTTLTDVARRAGVSRMTIYRRWPDMQTLLADLMTREWSGIAEVAAPTEAATAREQLATTVATTVGTLRRNELFAKIVEVDPELLLPYLLDRRGRTQDAILALTEAAITAGQQDGSVRTGDPVLMARALLLTAHGFALSAGTMTGGESDGRTDGSLDAAPLDTAPLDTAQLDGELRVLVERYLAP